MRRRSPFAPGTFAFLGALFFLACGPGEARPDAGDAGPQAWPDDALEIGSNVMNDFAPFPAEVPLVAGAQGGYHVEVRYRVNGMSAPEVLFTHRARKLDGTLVSRGTRRFDVELDGGVWVSDMFPVFMCPTPIGVSVSNETVTLEVEATSRDGGVLGRAKGTTKLHCEAGQYCEVICKG